MRKIQHLVIVVSLVSALLAAAIPQPAGAANRMGECNAIAGLGWRESGSESFTILYPREYAVIAQRLAAPRQRAALDDEYDRLEALFETSLATPISIRIYPDAETFTCLNANVPALPPGALHTHSGSREIVLIGSRILDNFSAWERSDLNFIRYELGVLFARQIAGDAAPAGLTPALGRYLQDPAQTLGMLQLHWSDYRAPTFGWRSLWEEDPAAPDLGRQLQAASTIAFLVDTYGWDSFLNFLQRLPASQNFNLALTEIYQADLPALEEQWRAYYPGYFQGGWRMHLLYNYDLSPYETLLAQEKYAEADTRLQAAIDFLTRMQDLPKLEHAAALMQRARRGQEAESLFGQSQQAFQQGDFPVSLALLEQAEQKYALAGARFYHMDEIAAHRDKVAQAHALRRDLAALRERAGSDWNTFLLAGQVLTLGRRLSGLGDVDGYNQVRQAAQIVEERQRLQYLAFALVMLALILALLALLVLLARRTPPAEAQL